MITSLGRTAAATAVLLAALAGFVDAMGYITLGGYFVSFMSGNSTRAAVAAVDGAGHSALVGAAVIGLFVLGVVAGSLLGRRAGRRRATAVLALMTVLLGVAAAFHDVAPTQVVIASMALAMGAENTVFERRDQASISLTYMTGTLVKLGQQIAGALAGGPRWAWVRFAVLWLGLVAGVVLGAAVHRWIGLNGMWLAVAASVFLAFRMSRSRGVG